MMHSLIAIGFLVLGADVPSDVASFLRTNDLELRDVCRAVEKLDITQKSSIADCREDDRANIEEVLGNECDKHYTLYGKTCQCNDSRRHSEIIVLEDTSVRRMANLKFPCQRKCYPTILRHILRTGDRVHISYAGVNRGTSAYAIHTWFERNCKDVLKGK